MELASFGNICSVRCRSMSCVGANTVRCVRQKAGGRVERITNAIKKTSNKVPDALESASAHHTPMPIAKKTWIACYDGFTFAVFIHWRSTHEKSLLQHTQNLRLSGCEYLYDLAVEAKYFVERAAAFKESRSAAATSNHTGYLGLGPGAITNLLCKVLWLKELRLNFRYSLFPKVFVMDKIQKNVLRCSAADHREISSPAKLFFAENSRNAFGA